MNTTQELQDFMSLSFPKNVEYDITYLDIITSQTKENTISKIYAHYLDFRKSPVISNWFISSLLAIIEEKSNKKLNLIEYDVFLEHASLENKGRIDIVIESFISKSVIIIENKIYHWLGNDLNNYWDTFNYYSEENKLGIVLALSNLPSNNPNFISISHIEWISKVESLIDPSKISVREKIHLEDFITNIKYITNQKNMNDNVKFYLDHSKKIEQILQYKEEATKYINGSISNLASKYNWEVYGNTLNYKQIWDQKNDVRVFYTLFPNEILKDKNLKIVIEIDGRARVYYDELIKRLREDNNVFDEYFIDTKKQNKNFAHLGYVLYPLEDEDLNNFESFLSKKIEELEPKRNLIFSHLKELGYEDKKTI